jgi:hypothetical protein
MQKPKIEIKHMIEFYNEQFIKEAKELLIAAFIDLENADSLLECFFEKHVMMVRTHFLNVIDFKDGTVILNPEKNILHTKIPLLGMIQSVANHLIKSGFGQDRNLMDLDLSKLVLSISIQNEDDKSKDKSKKQKTK